MEKKKKKKEKKKEVTERPLQHTKVDLFDIHMDIQLQ
jgi:hypothetical protein